MAAPAVARRIYARRRAGMYSHYFFPVVIVVCNAIYLLEALRAARQADIADTPPRQRDSDKKSHREGRRRKETTLVHCVRGS